MGECQKIRKLIPLFLEEQLNPAETQFVKNHLETCGLCRTELKLHEKAWQMISDYKDIKPQPGYESRFCTRLATEEPRKESFVAGLQRLFQKKRLSAAFAVISIIIIISFLSRTIYFNQQEANAMLAMSPEEIEFVDNIELAANFDIIENLDLLEDLETLEHWDVLDS